MFIIINKYKKYAYGTIVEENITMFRDLIQLTKSRFEDIWLRLYHRGLYICNERYICTLQKLQITTKQKIKNRDDLKLLKNNSIHII